MIFVQAIPFVGAGLAILIVHHVFIVDTVRVDDGRRSTGGVTEDESGQDREGVLVEELHHHRARVGILLGQRHVEAKQHDEVLEKQNPVVRLEGKAIVDDLIVS